MASSVQVLKEYFGTKEKPIVSQELIALRKTDPAGYDELALGAAKQLGVTLDK